MKILENKVKIIISLHSTLVLVFLNSSLAVKKLQAKMFLTIGIYLAFTTA